MFIDLKPIKTGTVLKVWQRQRGHDYIIVGKKTVGTKTKLLGIKNNCMNNDGRIHKATKRMHIEIPVDKNEDLKVAGKVTRIIGERQYVGAYINEFLEKINETNVKKLLERDHVYAPVNDARTVTTWR